MGKKRSGRKSSPQRKNNAQAQVNGGSPGSVLRAGAAAAAKAALERRRSIDKNPELAAKFDQVQASHGRRAQAKVFTEWKKSTSPKRDEAAKFRDDHVKAGMFGAWKRTTSPKAEQATSFRKQHVQAGAFGAWKQATSPKSGNEARKGGEEVVQKAAREFVRRKSLTGSDGGDSCGTPSPKQAARRSSRRKSVNLAEAWTWMEGSKGNEESGGRQGEADAKASANNDERRSLFSHWKKMSKENHNNAQGPPSKRTSVNTAFWKLECDDEPMPRAAAGGAAAAEQDGKQEQQSVEPPNQAQPRAYAKPKRRAQEPIVGGTPQQRAELYSVEAVQSRERTVQRLFTRSLPRLTRALLLVQYLGRAQDLTTSQKAVLKQKLLEETCEDDASGGGSAASGSPSGGARGALTAAIEVFEMDNDFAELCDTYRRVSEILLRAASR